MADPILKKIISYTLIASVFITGPAFIDFPFSLFWFMPVYALFLVYATIVYGKININILVTIVGLCLYSIFSMKSNPELIIKQLVNIIFGILVFYNFIVHENFNLAEILRKYTQFAKVILVIGFVQVALFLAGLRSVFLAIFPYLRETNISERFQSLSDEPSFIALTFIPVVFIALHNLFYNTRYIIGRAWCVLFIIGYLLTFSSAAFLALIIMAFILYLKEITISKGALAAGFCVVVLAAAALSYSRIEYIKVRVDDTLFALEKDFSDPDVYKSVNLSTYAFLSNVYVTRKAAQDNPVTGRGLGTHEVSYDLYLPEEMKEYSQLNRKDANSMALRLLSETGIIGTCIFIIVVIALKVRRRFSDNGNELLWLLNTAIFVAIIIILLRHGNYTSGGKMLFLLLYYYSYRFYSSPEVSSSLSGPRDT